MLNIVDKYVKDFEMKFIPEKSGVIMVDEDEIHSFIN